jgi:hypothetical protein
MVDTFAGKDTRIDGPAANGIAITTNDSLDLANVTRGIYVGGTGDVKVNLAGSGTVTFSAVPVGTILPVRASRVYATGTTATLLIGLY